MTDERREMMDALAALSAAFVDASEKWATLQGSDAEADEILTTMYPFKESFDEVSAEVALWNGDVSEQFKKYDTKEGRR